MNYSVIVNADTSLGHLFAAELATQKANLILIGENMANLNMLRSQIKRCHQVYTHCFELKNTQSTDLINLCDFINDHFSVNILIHIIGVKPIEDLGSHTWMQVEHTLTSQHVTPLLLLHQFLPNLMLHVNPIWMQVAHDDLAWTSEMVKQILSDSRFVLKSDAVCLASHTVLTCEHQCSKSDILIYINCC